MKVSTIFSQLTFSNIKTFPFLHFLIKCKVISHPTCRRTHGTPIIIVHFMLRAVPTHAFDTIAPPSWHQTHLFSDTNQTGTVPLSPLSLTQAKGTGVSRRVWKRQRYLLGVLQGAILGTLYSHFIHCKSLKGLFWYLFRRVTFSYCLWDWSPHSGLIIFR